MRLLGNVFLFLLSAATGLLLIRALLDGITPKHKGKSLEDE